MWGGGTNVVSHYTNYTTVKQVLINIVNFSNIYSSVPLSL